MAERGGEVISEWERRGELGRIGFSQGQIDTSERLRENTNYEAAT